MKLETCPPEVRPVFTPEDHSRSNKSNLKACWQELEQNLNAPLRWATSELPHFRQQATSPGLVGSTGFEPVTFAMSTRRSTTELRSQSQGRGWRAKRGSRSSAWTFVKIV